MYGSQNKMQVYAVYKNIPKTPTQKGQKQRWTKVYQENGRRRSEPDLKVEIKPRKTKKAFQC